MMRLLNIRIWYRYSKTVNPKYAKSFTSSIHDKVNSAAKLNATRDLIRRTNYVIVKGDFCSADAQACIFRSYFTRYYASRHINEFRLLNLTYRPILQTRIKPGNLKQTTLPDPKAD